MYKLFLFLSLLLSLTSSQKYTRHDTPIIHIERTGVLYTGIDNFIQVAVPGYSIFNVIVTASPGSNIKPNTAFGPGHFIVRPDTTSPRMITISLSVKTGKGEKFMGKMDFPVRRLPLPKVYLGNFKPGYLSQDNLKTIYTVVAGYDEMDPFTENPYVTEFTFIYIPKNDDPIMRLTVKGNILTDEIKAKLLTAKSGDIILIKDVGTTYAQVLNGSIFTVK